jgi:serine/threonine protein phosphatase PrpC
MLARTVGLTDTGRRRRHNEDAYVVRPPIFAVADGMGGAQAGEIASRLAAETLLREPGNGGGVERVTALMQAANRRVYDHAHRKSSLSGMGTTMTLALLEDGLVSIGHVGDSRAYLIRGGTMEQLTNDHSLVAELQRSGKLSPEEAEQHPQRSVITRALGTDPDVDVDTYTVEPRPGDVFLLCSDGLTTMVGDEAILRIVEEHRHDLDAAARALVARANRGGGEDNITVVFFEIADERAASASGPAPAATVASEDEDTLSELDRVPSVDTAVFSADEVAHAVAAERRRQRDRRLLLAAAAVAAAAVLIAAVFVWAFWL